jgi:hypothetical protein
VRVKSLILGAAVVLCAWLGPQNLGAETFRPEYQQTLLLMTEVDLRLHLCHLQEFVLYIQLQPREVHDELLSGPPAWTLDTPLEELQGQALTEVLTCKSEAEEAIKVKLAQAEHELLNNPLAQEKLKGLVAAWLSALKVIPRMLLRKDELLSQQDSDRRALREQESALEIELFWSSSQPHNRLSRHSPRNGGGQSDRPSEGLCDVKNRRQHMTVSLEHLDLAFDRQVGEMVKGTRYFVKRPSYELKFVVPEAMQTAAGGGRPHCLVCFRVIPQTQAFVLGLQDLTHLYEDLGSMIEYLQYERNRLRGPAHSE